MANISRVRKHHRNDDDDDDNEVKKPLNDGGEKTE